MNQIKSLPAESSLAGRYIIFTVEEEAYAVDIMAVREIREAEELRKMPEAPPFVKGVINLRGRITPIFDLKARFGAGDTVIEKKKIFVILHVEGKEIGIIVDQVSDIATITDEDISRHSSSDRLVQRDYMSGVALRAGEMVVLLDIHKLFDAEDIAAAVA